MRGRVVLENITNYRVNREVGLPKSLNMILVVITNVKTSCTDLTVVQFC